MMPKVSGIEVCRTIKTNPETKDTLVLILSAKESQDDRIRGLEFGADEYISKPFHLASLARKIEYMLTKKG
jgi:two-component system phosphate regulon response regulator PhoB